MNAPMSRLMSEDVAPTAASAVLLSNLPTTMTSAALNSSCKMPVRASGTEKRMICGRGLPSVMTIALVFVAAMGMEPSYFSFGMSENICQGSVSGGSCVKTRRLFVCGWENAI